MNNGYQITVKQEEVYNFGTYKIELLRAGNQPGVTDYRNIWKMFVMRPGSSTWEEWYSYYFNTIWSGVIVQTEMEGNQEPTSGQLNLHVDDFSNMGWLDAAGSWHQWNPTGSDTNFQYIRVSTGTALWYPYITH